MRPMKQSGDLDIPKYWSDWRPQICLFSVDNIYVQLTQTRQLCWSSYENRSLSLFVGLIKMYTDHPAYQVEGPLGDPGFFVSCSTVLVITLLSGDYHVFG